MRFLRTFAILVTLLASAIPTLATAGDATSRLQKVHAIQLLLCRGKVVCTERDSCEGKALLSNGLMGLTRVGVAVVDGVFGIQDGRSHVGFLSNLNTGEPNELLKGDGQVLPPILLNRTRIETQAFLLQVYDSQLDFYISCKAGSPMPPHLKKGS